MLIGFQIPIFDAASQRRKKHKTKTIGSLKIEIWILFGICYLMLGIFSIQGFNCNWIFRTTFLSSLWNASFGAVAD
jgi:hypothetical protein